MLREHLRERLASLDCVIFDLDGVLFAGTNQGYFDCHEHALRSVGLVVERAELRRRLLEYWSHPHEFQLALFIREQEKLASACRAYEEFLFSAAFTDRISEIPGAAAAVAKIRASGHILAAASGMHHRQIPTSLAAIGVEPGIFSACLSAYQLPDDELQKPHPYMVEKILGEVGRVPERALYIGDSRDDMRMARAAGVLAVAVLTGNMSRDDAVDERPDLILESVRDLPDAIAAKENRRNARAPG
jgi:phosphoglycolate phosphatase